MINDYVNGELVAALNQKLKTKAPAPSPAPLAPGQVAASMPDPNTQAAIDKLRGIANSLNLDPSNPRTSMGLTEKTKAQREDITNKMTMVDPLEQLKAYHNLTGEPLTYIDSRGIQRTEPYEGVQEYADQKAGIENLQNRLQTYLQNSTTTDLAPIVGYFDQLAGTKNLQTYIRPESAESLQKNAYKMEQVTQDERNKLMERVNDWLSKSRGGSEISKYTTGSEFDMLARLATLFNRGGTGGREDRIYERAKKSFDQKADKFKKSVNYANEVVALMSSNSPADVLKQKLVENIIPRMEGEVGALSQYDKVGASTGRAAASRLAQLFQTMVSGDLTDENKRAVIALASEFRDAGYNEISKVRDDEMDSWIAVRPDLDEDRLRRVFAGQDTKRDTKPSEKPSKGPGGMMSIDEFFKNKKK